ncbi:hypothetical protein B0T19DRAFT_350140 [Cercophora scortea]|uniref:Uncharacterized protein n=1 Tax=Cercophora scortea TaxID=314031 RepID=A0AAE0J5Y7_9PEZI|nr:hypothetical protein B0T19DRAFT_350140 [Cercophora scortea]
MNYLQLTQTLTESFSALADEVQSLIDRKTILEHKLRYAHEQYQYLADKYAPAVPEVSEILAKLQLPPDTPHPLAIATSVVPLPKRDQAGSSQHQIALLIREGRKAAQELMTSMGEESRDSTSSKESSVSPDAAATMTTTSTVLEQDFTVAGKKGLLACPFSPKPEQLGEPRADAEPAHDLQDLKGTTVDPTPHQSSDPICSAMIEETTSVPAPAASKCPIRFLDKHSPEEIAHYVETHKHEIPRSHEVCVRRYQKNEEQIRKLDAKYGNLVSMIDELSHLHQPMLPSPAAGATVAAGGAEDLDRASNDRVKNWAQTISTSDPEQQENEMPVDDEDRESRFDRIPLRDVRVGESPSRPWGIPVPLAHAGPASGPLRRPESPYATPVRMRSPLRATGEATGGGAPKCPFDHTMKRDVAALPKHKEVPTEAVASAEKEGLDPGTERPPFTQPVKNPVLPAPSCPRVPPQPTFVNPAEIPMPQADKGGPPPQVVFNITGPVFIGYPMEQAIQFMQRFQGQQ